LQLVGSSNQSADDAKTPAVALPSNALGNQLQAWVKFVEKDTQTQVQEYLEQVDAGQSGE
jgi:flavin-binding protein dodecin